MTDGIVINLDRIAMAAHEPAAMASLRRAAVLAATGPVLSVAQKPTAPPGGTANDYWSVGPYWWPDPNSPDGLPFVRRDGHVNPDFSSERYDRSRLQGFCQSIVTLALAAVVGDDRHAATNAVSRLRIWFINPATRMNPNLRFGQAIPGHCDGRGIGLIDTHDLINVLDACLMLRRLGALADDDFAAIRSWFNEFLDWMLTHPYGIAERNEHNNHGTWCDAQLAAFALFVERNDLARDIVAAVPERRIDPQIAPDGSQPHELARTRTLTYSCFNLHGFYTLAWMGRHVGVDLWNYRSADGRSLRSATDFLAPYAAADPPWPFPELEPEAHLPPARTRLFKILRQAANAWGEPRYDLLAKACEPAEDRESAGICWPINAR